MTITRHLDFGVSARQPVGIDRPPASTSTIPAEHGQWNPSTGTTGLQYIEQTGPQAPQTGVTQIPNARTSDTQNPLPHEKRRAEIEAKLAAAPNEDHFQLLGLPREATTTDVKNAYFAMAKSFHPDKLPKELADLRPRVQQLFALINSAFEELSDEGRRAEYLTAISGPITRRGKPSMDEQELVARALDAAAAFQRAEVLQKTDLAGAEVYARRAVDADPGEPSYMTLLAWIQAQQRPIPPTLDEGKTSPIYDDLIAQLDAVIKKEPSYERAIFYRAVLLKRSGRTEMAMKDFTRAAALNPKNIDAAREVRLYEMRKGNKGSAPGGDPGGGLFGKFFKR
jgi:curved DNA-binding protein CbpA